LSASASGQAVAPQISWISTPRPVAWRDTFANNRVHDVTGKVPALAFEHEERRVLHPIPDVPVQHR
jgi:hypothetical protein